MPITRDQVFPILQAASPVCTQAALATVEPQLVALGIALQRNSAWEIRGRLYLPTSAVAGPAQVVDVVGPEGWGGPWAWIDRGLDPNVVLPAPPLTPPTPPAAPDCSQCALLQTGVEALIALRDGLEVVKSELASANEQRQVIMTTLSRIYTRFEATPTREQLSQTVIPVKFKW